MIETGTVVFAGLLGVVEAVLIVRRIRTDQRDRAEAGKNPQRVSAQEIIDRERPVVWPTESHLYRAEEDGPERRAHVRVPPYLHAPRHALVVRPPVPAQRTTSVEVTDVFMAPIHDGAGSATPSCRR